MSYPHLRSIVDILADRAKDQPAKIAYTFLKDGEGKGEDLTYAELDRRSRAVAARLTSCAKGDPVLLVYPPGLDFVTAFLGCLYARAIAVPVRPPSHRQEPAELAAIIDDSGAKVGLAPDSMIPRLGLRDVGVEWLNHSIIYEPTPVALDTRGTLPQVAYLQYTSGSVADPKGVMVSHENLIHNLAYIDEDFRHTEESVSVSWLPHFHDMGLVYGLLAPLYKGFRCILMSPAAFLQRPDRWLRAITTFKATHSGGPDFAYELCARRISDQSKHDLGLATWRIAFTGSEMIRKSTLDTFSERFFGCGFSNEAFRPAYGMAEATLKISSRSGEAPLSYCAVDANRLEQHSIEAPLSGSRSRVIVGCGSIGSGMHIAVVRPDTCERCGESEVGELWVAGPSVTLGYWRRPAETTSVFHGTLPSTGLNYLKTGDLGFLREGQLFITGRLKDLIIIRGRNYYPEEIESAAYKACPQLRPGSCAAFSIDLAEHERLIVVQELGKSNSNAFESMAIAIRQTIAANHGVQAHAIAFVPIGRIPKTSSGKTRRRRCRQLYLEGKLELLGQSRVPEGLGWSRDSNAGDVSALLGRILGCADNELQEDCSLTAQGLDSLLAAELSNAIEQEWGVAIHVADLLGSITVKSLRQQLAAIPLDGKDVPPAITRLPTSEWAVLSEEQERVFILDELLPGSAAYNLIIGLRIVGRLDRRHLFTCIDQLIRRHSILRTTFERARGELRQKVIAFEDLDHEHRSVFVHSRDVATEIENDRAKPFNLGRPPLIRANLLNIGSNEHVLLLTTHHIVSDARSLVILATEVAQLYAHGSGEDSGLNTDIQFSDFVSWQKTRVTSEVVASGVRYWEQQLRGAGNARHGVHDLRSLAYSALEFDRLDFTDTLVSRLRERCREFEVTAFMWLLTVFYAAYFELTGQVDIVVGVPVSGRDHRDLKDLIGFFAHPLPVRTQVSEGDTFRNLLRSVKSRLLGAYAHQNIPLAKIAQIARFGRDNGRTMLFDAMFSIIVEPEIYVRSRDLTVEPFDIPTGARDAALCLTLVGRNKALRGWVSSPRVSAAVRGTDVHKALMRVLERSLEDVDTRVTACAPTAQQPSLAVVSSFRAESLEPILEFWMRKFNTPHSIERAEYNQVWQELLNPNGLLARNRAGANVLLIRFEDWDRRRNRNSDTVRRTQSLIDEFLTLLPSAAASSSVPTLVCLCPASPTFLEALGGQLVHDELERYIAGRINAIPGWYGITSSETLSLYPVPGFYDAFSDEQSDVPFTAPFFASLATIVARRYYSIGRPPKKVIILDCDETLWGGVCAEDGYLGITIDHPRRELQQFMLTCAKSGMLLCLCSKNSSADVMQVFENRKDMLLNLDSVAAWRFNWDSKPNNVRSIAAELGLSLSEVIFVDDNPAECIRMRSECPEVLTVQLPGEVSRIPHFLRHLWAFDIAKVTAEDAHRAAAYKQDVTRNQVRSTCLTAEEFISRLDLKIQLSSASDSQIERVATLTQRTNQLNTSGTRRTAADVKALLRSGYECQVAEVEDRFGQYGLVGAILFCRGERQLDVDTFLLSCRVLGRGVEHRMLEMLLDEARRATLDAVNIRFVSTGRNIPALNFFQSAGPSERSESGTVSIFRFAAHKTNIGHLA